MAKIDTFVAADNYFSQLPHWVLYADISPQAIRLYAVLQHYANKQSEAWPSRNTLAKEIRVKSPRTVDSAIDELIAIGAVKVENRFKGNEFDSNRYIVITSAPPIAENCTTPIAENCATYSNNLLIKKNQLNISIQKEPIKDTSRFEIFWNAYPRKAGKGAARIAFTKAVTKATFTDIMAGVERLANDPNLDLQYCPHASTWLNQERWEDEPLPGKQSKNINSIRQGMSVTQKLEEMERGNVAIGDF